jgi:hypothetical protein
MKNLSITVAVTALVAFSLGYIARGPVERAPSISKDSEELTIREDTDGPAAQAHTIVRADPSDVNAPSIASLDYGAVLTTTHSSPRAPRVRRKRDRLGDFFVINGIGSERAEQIIQDLVDADHYIVQKQDAMIDRHTAKKAELIAQGGVVGISLTAGESAELKAEQETLYRQIFGEYYEAHEEYRRSHVQRLVVGSFSSNLPEPLDYTTRETMVQIMYEENSRFVSELESETAGSGVRVTSTPQGWEAEKDKYHKQLDAKRTFYDRVMDRTTPYLTASQSEQFKRLLDNDIRRFELLIELEDVEEAH